MPAANSSENLLNGIFRPGQPGSDERVVSGCALHGLVVARSARLGREAAREGENKRAREPDADLRGARSCLKMIEYQHNSSLKILGHGFSDKTLQAVN